MHTMHCMMKKTLQILTCFCFFSASMYAQLDTPNTSVRIEATENNEKDPSGIEWPAVKTPSLSNESSTLTPNVTQELGEQGEEKLDISTDDGFLSLKSDKAPKYFSKDKEIKEEYNRDMFLGDVKTKGSTVNVLYRDHEFVDGDRIRVYVNGDIVQSNVFLSGSFRGFDLTLEKGYNRVEFEALNQGSSGPNTAELHVYDDNGMIISAKEWNLLTGRRATIVVIKE